MLTSEDATDRHTAGFGVIAGVLEAPSIQLELRPLGVDQISFLPAIPIILLFAVLCGLSATAGAR